MSTNIARAYYEAMGDKDVSRMEKHLHENLRFKTPLATLEGKEAYLEALRNFCRLFDKLNVRTVFGSEDQAVLIYDLEFPDPIGAISAAAVIDFEGAKIVNIELIYDARPFVDTAIFTKAS